MKVLVPFDVRPLGERAVRAALDLFGDGDDVHIVALHVSDRAETPAEIAAHEIESMGEEYDATVEAEISVVDHGAESKAAIRTAITDVVEAEAIDLVVLGYESKSAFERLLESGSTERLLQTHEVPVLLVP